MMCVWIYCQKARKIVGESNLPVKMQVCVGSVVSYGWLVVMGFRWYQKVAFDMTTRESLLA